MKNVQYLSINLNEPKSLMCAVIARRLRSLKWDGDDIERIGPKALEKVVDKIDDNGILEELAADASSMKLMGVPNGEIQIMVNAAFAMIAVEIADAIHSSMVAERN
jgi:hypothetical protein